MTAAKKTTVDLNVDYIKQFARQKGIVVRRIAEEMGRSSNHLANILHVGRMDKSEFKFMCLLMGMREEDAMAPKTPKEVPGGATNKSQTDCFNENTELIVSYIQDLGKIQTEILRTIKEGHEILAKMIAEMSETIKDLKVENHKDLQAQTNYIKYGRK